VLLLDKPVGLSSNAALQRVRGLFEHCKAGHTGSLDPLASGMLPICLGEATKLAGELLAGRKAYVFGLKLGERTATGDAEGPVLERCALPTLAPDAIEAVLRQFRGAQTQIPPMYSALKRDGQPLYRLARQGVQVAREPRALVIDSLEVLEISVDRCQLRVVCSKGTYVRVLGEDIARALGSCGHLYALRREYVEPFEEAHMWTLEMLQAQVAGGGQAALCAALLPADAAVARLPALHLDDTAASAIAHGQVLQGLTPPAPATLWRLYDAQRRFLGLGESDAGGWLRVRRLFSSPLPAAMGNAHEGARLLAAAQSGA